MRGVVLMGLLAGLVGCSKPGPSPAPPGPASRPASRPAAAKLAPMKGTAPDLTASRVVKVATGGSHTCALHRGGYLTCFGDNGNFQLSPRPVKAGADALAPRRVAFAHRITDVAAGSAFSCAATDAGEAHCWGWIFTDHKKKQPRKVPGLTGVVALSATGSVVCALRRPGDAVCWGLFPGAPDSRPYRLRPLMVKGRVTSVAANERFTCVTLADGAARCRGDLPGRNKATKRWIAAPVIAPAGARFVRVVATAGHACLETWPRHKGPVCFGSDSSGQISGAQNSKKKTLPAFVRGARYVVAAASRTCAVSAAGRVACWGHGYYGEDGVDPDAPVVGGVVPVRGIKDAVQVAAGRYHTCALQRDGALFCWGSNEHGQLGDGNPAYRRRPVDVGLRRGVTLLRGRWHDTCALASGKVTCWGAVHQPGPWPRAAGFYGKVRSFDGAQVSMCAVMLDGSIGCGYFEKGRRCKVPGEYRHCAFTSRWQRSSLLKSPGKVTTLAADRVGNVCVLLKGRAYCVFNLGEAGGFHRNKWLPVPGVSDATALESSSDAMCAVVGRRGRVKCWRDHRYDADEDFAKRVPKARPALVAGVQGVTSLAGGMDAFCAVTRNKELRCWRPAASKDHSPIMAKMKAKPVPGVPRAEQVSGSDAMFCSVLAGKVTCWGRGKWQKGLPYARRREAAKPEQIKLPRPAKLVGVGYGHACAMTDNDHLWCWGLNDGGQLGDGRVAVSYKPVRAKVLR